MLKLTRMAGLLAAMALAVMWVAPAQAQATRTWISGTGDDVNPCSRTAPCKTFAGAISKTATGGEIDCLDPAGYGAVTVVKSITLDCGGGIGGQAGSILASGTNGITINDSSGATPGTALVKIRNMSINGIQKAGGAGLSGIKFITGGALIVEHVGIFGFGGTPDNNGGVDFEPTTAGSKLEMLDVEIQYGLGDGVLVKPASTGTGALATLNRVSSLNNIGVGVRVDDANVASGTGANVTVSNSMIAGNATGLAASSAGTSSPVQLQVLQSTVSNNTSFGMTVTATSTLRFGGNVVTGNATGIAGAGALKSWGDNYFGGNGSDGTPTTPNLTKL
jgi:hypothetical protein